MSQEAKDSASPSNAVQGKDQAIPTPKAKSKRKPPKRSNSLRAKSVRATGAPTSARAAKLALNWIDFQKTTFDNSLKLFGVLQDQTDKALHQLLGSVPYLPKEGRKMVEEWMKAVRRNRDEFRKAMDRSFDLISNYLQRIQSEEEKPRTAPPVKNAARRGRA